MIKDAEDHADEDKTKREQAELKNNADNIIFTAEKLLKDNEEKVPEELKNEIEANVTSLKDALNEDNADSINKALQELQGSVQKVGEAVYTQPDASTENDTPPTEDGSSEQDSENDDTVEGEYREV